MLQGKETARSRGGAKLELSGKSVPFRSEKQKDG